MAACERCWREYQFRLLMGCKTTYSAIVAERDRTGGCTPEEQCGELHLVCVKDERGPRCRCGLKRADEVWGGVVTNAPRGA